MPWGPHGDEPLGEVARRDALGTRLDVSFHLVSTMLGWSAVVFGTWSAYVQLSRVRRRGGEGVSLATWTLFVLLAFFWIAYGLTARSWPLVAASAVVLPLQIAIMSELHPWRHRALIVRAVVFLSIMCCAPSLWWGWNGAVAGAGIAGSLTRAPQLVALVRPAQVTGVSPGSWVLSALVSLMWVVYYWGAHLWVVLGVTAFAGGVSLAIAVLSYRRLPGRGFEMATPN